MCDFMFRSTFSPRNLSNVRGQSSRNVMLETGQHEFLRFRMCCALPSHLLGAIYRFFSHRYSVRGKSFASAPFGTFGYSTSNTERHVEVLDLRRENINYCDAHTHVNSLFYEDSSGFIVRS